MRNKNWIVVITFLCLILGFLISVQYKAQQAASSSLDTQSETDLAAILQELNQKRADLMGQKSSLQEDFAAQQAESDSETAAVDNLTKENSDLSIADMSVPAQGPGISIVLASADNIISTDLVDIVNELWVTGAEAVAVNSIRIDQQSYFSTMYEDGNQKTLALNGTALTLPITIHAIGDGQTLLSGMQFPGGILSSLQSSYHVEAVVKIEDKLVLPAAP